MLRWRLLLAVLIIAALIGLCWLDYRQIELPGVWLLPVAVGFALLAAGEVLNMARAGGMSPLALPAYLGCLLLVLAPWAPIVVRWPHGGRGDNAAAILREGAEYALVALSIGVLLTFWGEMRRYQKPGGITANIAAVVFTLVYVGVMLALAVQIRLAWGIGAMASWIIVVKMGDIGAYTVGRLIGRHKLAPVLSPGKTIEGACGALAFSCLGAWASFAWLVPLLSPAGLPPGPRWGWLLYGLLLGIGGILGDLAESLLKRDAGCKDSSRWMPGFGGVLDIVDSLLLTAPVAWLCWLLGLVGR